MDTKAQYRTLKDIQISLMDTKGHNFDTNEYYSNTKGHYFDTKDTIFPQREMGYGRLHKWGRPSAARPPLWNPLWMTLLSY